MDYLTREVNARLRLIATVFLWLEISAVAVGIFGALWLLALIPWFTDTAHGLMYLWALVCAVFALAIATDQ